MIRLAPAMVLSPLLFVKVLVARCYKNYYSLLMPIGLVIFVLSFVLIDITAGPSLAHRARMQTVWPAAVDLPPAAIDVDMAAATTEKHGIGIPSSCWHGQCGTCETKRLAGKVRMDAEEELDPYWKAQGFVPPCVGHAEGAVKLDA